MMTPASQRRAARSSAHCRRSRCTARGAAGPRPPWEAPWRHCGASRGRNAGRPEYATPTSSVTRRSVSERVQFVTRSDVRAAFGTMASAPSRVRMVLARRSISRILPSLQHRNDRAEGSQNSPRVVVALVDPADGPRQLELGVAKLRSLRSWCRTERRGGLLCALGDLGDRIGVIMLARPCADGTPWLPGGWPAARCRESRSQQGERSERVRCRDDARARTLRGLLTAISPSVTPLAGRRRP